MTIAHVDQEEKTKTETKSKTDKKTKTQVKTNTNTNTESDDFPPGQGGDPSDLIEPVEKEEEATRSSLHMILCLKISIFS